MDAELMAKLFHQIYEELAPEFNYETRKASAKPWFEVPENNKSLMIAVAKRILVVQKKQTEEDCVEDCSAIDSNRDLARAVVMLDNMVLSGETHSDESRETVKLVLAESANYDID